MYFIKKGLDSEAVAGQHQRVTPLIPNGKGKNSVYALKEIFFPFQITV